MSSAKALTKELLASQTFLVGLHSLPSYGDIEGKQAMVLLQVIDNLSSDEAAGILQLLDESKFGLNQIEKGQGCILASKTIASGHKDYFLSIITTAMIIPRIKIYASRFRRTIERTSPRCPRDVRKCPRKKKQ